MVSVPVPDTLSGMASDRLSSGVHWNMRCMLYVTPHHHTHLPGYSFAWKLLRTTLRSSVMGMQRAM